jgi:hypothetical protein
MLVVSKDGFIDWSWGSTPLFKSGVFFRARREKIAVPVRSLAANAQGSPLGSVHTLQSASLRHPTILYYAS